MLFRLKKPALGPPVWIIAGLGNPGIKYENTRHNAGFLALEKLAGSLSVKLDKVRFHAAYGMGVIREDRVLLLRPGTYMNNSGVSIAQAASFYKVPPERILVLCDEIQLNVGRLRIRRKGSHGGHNGLKSIAQHLHNDNYPRIKIGVGQKPHPDYDLADWVLSAFTKQDAPLLEDALTKTATAAVMIVSGEIDKAMSLYNG